MISDIDIVHTITTRQRGGQVVFSNDDDKMQYAVDDKHEWDFKKNTYVVVHRWKVEEDKPA